MVSIEDLDALRQQRALAHAAPAIDDDHLRTRRRKHIGDVSEFAVSIEKRHSMKTRGLHFSKLCSAGALYLDRL